ncbi:MAG: J domain-containing protein [Acidimicrobiales bacterium]
MASGKTYTHYEILGVTRQSDHDQIRRAYLSAARRWHPDRHSGKPVDEADKAEKAMQRVNQAWSVLGDKANREAYDRQLVPFQAGSQPGSTGSTGIRTDDGVTRIDPRLLDPEFLASRRNAQLTEISARSSYILRMVPIVAVIGFMAAIFVFTAYARDNGEQTTVTTVPGPNLGAGIAANDCVVITSGPALIKVPCTSTAAGRVIGATLDGVDCPLGTDRQQVLSNGTTVCLDSIS